MEWYYSEAGQRRGPVDEPEFQALCAAGTVKPDTLVWKAGMGGWQPLSVVDPGLAARYVAAVPSAFGPPVIPGARHYGGFWIRVLARIIDGLILSVAFIPVALILGLIVRPYVPSDLSSTSYDVTTLVPLYSALALFYMLQVVASSVYEGWFLSTRGATPGKMALGLRVIRPTGENVTFARGVSRLWAQFFSAVIFYIGYIIAAIDEEKRALHDRICDTRVIYK